MTTSKDAHLNPISLSELAPTLASVGRRTTTNNLTLVPKHGFKSQDVPGFVFAVLTEDEREIGVATALLAHDRITVEDIGHFGIELDPSVRGQGFGTQIAEALLSLYREQGIREVLLTVDRDNESAARACRRLGGEYLDEVPASAGQGGKLRFILKLS